MTTQEDEMTCRELTQHLDRLLAGDVIPSQLRSGASRQHLAECPACAGAWKQVTHFLGLLRAPDGEAVSDDAVDTARTRLRAAFGQRGQPVVRFDTLATPVGRLFVGVSDRGVCDITLGDPDEDAYRHRLLDRAPEVLRDPSAVEPVKAELDAYFRGRLEQFTQAVDLRGVTSFTRRVLRATRKIRFGQLLSYGDVARQIGSPHASRAVGGALGRNPVPIMVPCHRVVARGGRLGGFTGGIDTKRALLLIEGHPGLPT